jgi:fido (protein-threonine AMPylation protein)
MELTYVAGQTPIDADEAAGRPFPNGNGRHARLLADLLVTQLGGERFTWGSHANLGGAGATRTRYIDALKAADQGDHLPLLEFARS